MGDLSIRIHQVGRGLVLVVVQGVAIELGHRFRPTERQGEEGTDLQGTNGHGWRRMLGELPKGPCVGNGFTFRRRKINI